jgi:hypothetical protein
MSEYLDLLKDQFEKRRGRYRVGDPKEIIARIGLYEREILEQIANEIRIKMMDDFVGEFNKEFTEYRLEAYLDADWEVIDINIESE